MHRIVRGALFLSSLAITAAPLRAQVYRLAEMNTTQIARLDHARTVVLIPGGIMEEHGPYLPSFTDAYLNDRLTTELANAIARRPGWAAVIMPTIPLGSGAANEIGAKSAFPGSYTVRPATLRAVFMDLASELGEQGFKWAFIIHDHGSPWHNQALDQAADFFRDTYGGRMVHLTGLLVRDGTDSIATRALGAAAMAENGVSVHGSVIEHSRAMALQPNLVSPAIKTAPSVTGKSIPDLLRIARAPDWIGYFGAPRFASADLGRQLVAAYVTPRVALALQILDGADDRTLPRYATMMAGIPAIVEVGKTSAARDARIEQTQREWLAKNGRQP